MKIYIAHSTGFDFHNELYKVIRGSDLNSKHEFILPHEDSQVQFSSRDFFKNKSVDLVIAEVSFPSIGMGIELGWADSFRIKIAAIYRSGSKVSGSIRSVTDTLVEYGDSDLVDKLEVVLSE